MQHDLGADALVEQSAAIVERGLERSLLDGIGEHHLMVAGDFPSRLGLVDLDRPPTLFSRAMAQLTVADRKRLRANPPKFKRERMALEEPSDGRGKPARASVGGARPGPVNVSWRYARRDTEKTTSPEWSSASCENSSRTLQIFRDDG